MIDPAQVLPTSKPGESAALTLCKSFMEKALMSEVGCFATNVFLHSNLNMLRGGMELRAGDGPPYDYGC
jgi:hypothetical protein